MASASFSGGWRGARDGRALIWAAVGLATFAVMAGLAPGFWSLPLMSKVQFPWRALALQEFALASIVALTPTLALRHMAALAAALLVGNPVSLSLAKDLVSGQVAGRLPPGAPTAPYYAPEYLPRGMLVLKGVQPSPLIPLETLATLPLASGDGIVAGHADSMTGSVRLSLAARTPRLLVLRRFYFPSWHVRCDGHDVRAGPAGPARLVGFVAPAGARDCDARIGLTSQERFGYAATLASLVLICLYGLATLAVEVRSRRWPRFGARPS